MIPIYSYLPMRPVQIDCTMSGHSHAAILYIDEQVAAKANLQYMNHDSIDTQMPRRLKQQQISGTPCQVTAALTPAFVSSEPPPVVKLAWPEAGMPCTLGPTPTPHKLTSGFAHITSTQQQQHANCASRHQHLPHFTVMHILWS